MHIESSGRWARRAQMQPAEWVIAALGGIAVLVALVLLAGLMSKGLSFMLAIAPRAQWVILALAGFGVVLTAAAVYVVRKKSLGPGGAGRSGYYYGRLPATAAVVVLALYATAALLLIFTVLQFDIAAAAPVRPDRLGIAIADFSSPNGSAAEGRELRTLLARSLRRQIQSSPGLSGRVAVVSAPAIQNEEQAREYATRNGVQLVIWGRTAGEGHGVFVPSVADFAQPVLELRHGDAPTAPDVPLTGSQGVELGEITSQEVSRFSDYLAGLIYLDLRSYREAAGSFDRAATEDPAAMSPGAQVRLARTLAVFYLASGKARAELGQGDAARAAYELALRHDPAYAEAYIGLGNLEYERGNCGAALARYDRAVALAPKLPASWYARGSAFYCAKNFASAASDYRTAVSLARAGDQAAGLYHLVLGATLCEAGQTPEGMAELASARSGSLAQAVAAETARCTARAQSSAKAGNTGTSGQSGPTPGGETVGALLSRLAAELASQAPSPTPAQTATPLPATAWVPTAAPTPTPTYPPFQTMVTSVTPASASRAVPATPLPQATQPPQPAPTAAPVSTLPPPTDTAATRPPAPLPPTQAPPSATPVPPSPTWTPVPPATVTPVPMSTATPVPPTSTPLPPSPTATALPPPTNTLVPPSPTATTAPPPTNTAVPPPSPTATSRPPLPTPFWPPAPTLTPAPAATPTPAAPLPAPTSTPEKGKGKPKPTRHPTKTPKP